MEVAHDGVSSGTLILAAFILLLHENLLLSLSTLS